MDPRPSIISSPASSSSSSSSSSPADLVGTGSVPEQAQAPTRRRLVKASMRAHLDDARKRDVAGVGSAPPGFAPPGFGGSVADWGQTSNSPNVTSVMGSASPLPAPIMTGNVASGFRDRDRATIRSINKDFPGDYQASLSHSTSKLGRPPHIANPAAMEARPLGRRVESLRRHDSCSQKHGEELKMQQAKRAALVRAQQAGATGNFKSFDSQFSNFLVPVIPMQFLAKVQSHSVEMG